MAARNLNDRLERGRWRTACITSSFSPSLSSTAPCLHPVLPPPIMSISAPLSTASPYLSHLHRMPYLHTYELKRKGICVRAKKRRRGEICRQAVADEKKWKRALSRETATSLSPPFSLSHSFSPALFQFFSRPFRSHLGELRQRPPSMQNIWQRDRGNKGGTREKITDKRWDTK